MEDIDYNYLTDTLDLIDIPLKKEFKGSDCTGSSPAKNRTLSTSGVTFVYLDGLLLQETTQYTVSGNTITFLVNVRDSQKIIVVN